MQKQFVKSEIAKKLKEKGFNEPTMAYYNEKDEFVFTPYNNEDINLPNKVTKTENENNYSSAPLWQQAIDWIAEKYKIEIATTSWKKEGTKDEIIWVYSIEPLGKPCLYGFKNIFPSKVEALKFAIEEALKLI